MVTAEQVYERNRVRAYLALRQAGDALEAAKARVDELAEMVADYRTVHWSDARCMEALGATERARTEIRKAELVTGSFPDETESTDAVPEAAA